jgi:hypothetical protein
MSTYNSSVSVSVSTGMSAFLLSASELLASTVVIGRKIRNLKLFLKWLLMPTSFVHYKKVTSAKI